MRRINFPRSSFIVLIIIANFIFYVLGEAILKYVHDEGWANAISVYLGVGSTVVITYLNSESVVQVKTFLSHFLAGFDKPFFVLMIGLVQATTQLISSVLPEYIKNQVILIALQVFIPLVSMALVTYLSSEEPQTAQVNKSQLRLSWWETLLALITVILILVLAIVLAVHH